MIKFSLSAPLLFLVPLALVPALASAQTWNGAYIGGSISEGKPSTKHSTLSFDTNLDGKYGDTVMTSGGADAFAPGFCSGRPNGLAPAAKCTRNNARFGLGAVAGYDWQMGNLVFGVLGAYNGATFRDSVTGFSSTPNTYTFTRKVGNIASLRGRLGYAAGHWLVYGTAGYATAEIHRTFTTSNALNSFTATPSRNSDGYQAGIGIEKQYSGHWIVGLEYLFTSLDDRGGTVRAGPSSNTFASNAFLTANASGTDIRRRDDKFKLNTVLITAKYRFGSM